MGDKQVGHAELALQLLQQAQHLGADGHVEGAGGLIADNQFRLHRQRPGNGDALQLATGEFVGIAVAVFTPQLDPVQQQADTLLPLPERQPHAQADHALGDNFSHRHPRVHGGKRVLEYHLDQLAVGQHFAPRQRAYRIALKADSAVADGLQVEDGPPQGGLATARLPHQCVGFAAAYSQRHAVHRPGVIHHALQHAPADGEIHLHLFQLQQRLLHRQALEMGKIRQRVYQAATVGFFRVVEKLIHRRPLDNLAAVHHRHLVGGIADHAHIVGNQQHRQLARVGQFANQLQHLLLDGDVQRGGGLVGDQDIGFAGQRHGDHDALLLAAG